MSKFYMNAFRLFCLLTLCLAITAPVLHAQKEKIDYKDDLILVDGQAVAKMVKRTHDLGVTDYSISGLTGPELLFVKAFRGPDRWNGQQMVAQWYQEYNFIASGAKAEMPLRFGNYVAKVVAENKLIEGNAIDPAAEQRFIQLYNGHYPQPSQPAQPANPTVVVNVSGAAATTVTQEPSPSTHKPSKSPVTIEGNKAMRDGEVIGKFRDETTNSNFSQSTRVVTIYNTAGERVAEATAPAEKPEEWSIRTLADDKQVSLLYDTPTEMESLLKWLADKGYLGE